MSLRCQIVLSPPRSAAGYAALVAGLLDAAALGRATWAVVPAKGEGVLLGRWQVAATALSDAGRALPRARRATGGEAVHFVEGVVAFALALPDATSLLGGARIPPAKVLNRYVRPALGALAHAGLSAGYFGRDFVTVDRRQVALASFEVDARGRALVELFVGVLAPFALPAALSGYPARAPDAEPPVTTLREAGRTPDAASLAEGVFASFPSRLGVEAERGEPPADGVALPVDEALPARTSGPREVPIGFVEAHVALDGGVLSAVRLRGDLVATSPTIASLEQAMVGLPPSFDALGAAVDAALRAPDAALLGLREGRALPDAVLAACEAAA